MSSITNFFKARNTTRMAQAPQSSTSLFQLPEPCLVSVLSCLSDDPRSLFSAARAHSRLHKAAVESLSNIRAVVAQSQQFGSMMLYLDHHGQHVSSMDLDGCDSDMFLQQLPHAKLQGLSSLKLSAMKVRLLPWRQFRGVLGQGKPRKQLHLTQLRLHNCLVLDAHTLRAALQLLPKLQHLSLVWEGGDLSHDLGCWFPSSVLRELQHLTHLELSGAELDSQDGMQAIQGLTDLQDLRLQCLNTYCVRASMLSGLQRLTHLKVQGEEAYRFSTVFEPKALAGKDQLQHLELVRCNTVKAAELLSHLEHLQQLTYLSLSYSMVPTCPAAAYAALTASSKLQHLDLSGCTLPIAVWQHVLPSTGRQLQHLRALDISNVAHPSRLAAAPEGSRLVSSCRGLQSLQLQGLQYSAELLAPLTGLSGLQELSLGPAAGSSVDGLEVVPLLTSLQQLIVHDPSTDGRLLPQLTQLKQLTLLIYYGRLDGRNQGVLRYEASDEVPMSRQLLHGFLDHSDPTVAQHAATVLADLSCPHAAVLTRSKCVGAGSTVVQCSSPPESGSNRQRCLCSL